MMKYEQFDSVWDAIEKNPVVAANLKARSSVMIAVQETVKSWSLTQSAAAKRLGITQPRLNDLLRGQINKFSLDALMNLAAAADVTVKLEVLRPAA
jgi:predicted XRE-type DNA-binding protein